MSSGRLPRGDGVSAPEWHKSDREWPEFDGQKFDFIGQGYIESTVLYLFRGTTEPNGPLAIYNDEVNRQDAEDHYRREEEMARKGRNKRP